MMMRRMGMRMVWMGMGMRRVWTRVRMRMMRIMRMRFLDEEGRS